MKIEEPMWVEDVRNATFDLADLPDTIEDEIIVYLKIELGPEYVKDKEKLRYAGEFEYWGMPIRCWDFGDQHMYVSVQPYGNHYYVGFTDKSDLL